MTTQMLAPEFGPPDVLVAVEVELPGPAPGEVLIDVRASAVNPSDLINISGLMDRDPARLPVAPGYELSGVVSAIGAGTEIASGRGSVGDPVVAFCTIGGYTTQILVPADDVFKMPTGMTFAEAASLLLSATTAARMLTTVNVVSGEVIIVHGASGATGVSVVQQAALLGARVIGTCSATSFEMLQRFGATPVLYGPGLEQRIRDLAPEGVDAALDCVGTDEAVDVSFALVADRTRVVTIAAFPRAFGEDMKFLIGSGRGTPNDTYRSHVLALAESGDLVVPVARTFPLEAAAAALNTLARRHPGGKFVLVSSGGGDYGVFPKRG